MSFYRIVMIIAMLQCSIVYAQEQKNGNTQTQLFIQQSNFVEFKSTNITASNGAISIEGKFIILGNGIFGHFDMVAFDDSGKVIQKAMSEDRAWQRDHGGNLKSIALLMSTKEPAKVEVSFHEMRIHPEFGACKQ